MSGRWSRKMAAAVAALLGAGGPVWAQVAARGETVYTMAGPPVRDGVVLVGKDGTVERVGPASEVAIPAGYRTLAAKVITPGLVDAHSVVGLAGYLNQPHDQMQLETSSPVQPELRALDAYNAREPLVEWLRQHGVTTLHTGHAPGALVPGQTMIVKTVGDGAEEAVMVPLASVAVTLGTGGLGREGKSPGNRSKAIALLRGELVNAQEYRKKRQGPEDKWPAQDLRKDVLARVLAREVPLLVTAHRAHDILTALRVAKEFDLRVVLDGAAESYLVIDEIKAAGVPVILHPTMQRAGGDAENLSMETASVLTKAGIPVAIQSGYESYVPKSRVVLFEAAVAAAHGLSTEEALTTVTLAPARILGIAGRVGSLERGKDGDLVLFDGDPFEYTTHVTGVVVRGAVVSETVR